MILIVAIFLLNICGQTWKDVPKYYKSLAYVSFTNALYYYLFKRHLLWEFTPGDMNWKILRKIHIFFISPLLVLFYLSKLPQSLPKQVLHTMKWILASVFVEHYVVKQKMLTFKYGWNTIWSGMIYLQMYVYSYLFLKKPVLTWILSFCSIVFYMIKFKVPLTRRLLKGPYFLFFKKKRFPLKDRLKTITYPYYVYVSQELNRLKV